MAHILKPRSGLSRRNFLKTAGGLAALGAASPAATVFSKPSSQLSGELKILTWSHFVPQYDVWFDQFAENWGLNVGVDVTVDHISFLDLPAAAAGELAAGEGHDLIENIFPVPQFEPSVLDLTDVNEEASARHGDRVPLTVQSSFNPVTNKWHSFTHGWVPDPGDYVQPLWEQVGFPNGPSTWQELLEGGAEIRDSLGVQMGIGLGPGDIDADMAARAVIWSFGGSVQDENNNVTINSPETIAAVEFMKELFERAMTPEVLGWNAASNNNALIAGEASWILNSISAYRSLQSIDPETSDGIHFTSALAGPTGIALASEHVIYNYVVPNHSTNPDAAKEFMLHLVENYDQAVFNSKLYNFPSWNSTSPTLFQDGGWLDVDPFGSRPTNKLALLKDTLDWSTIVGHPGPSHAAIGEVFFNNILPLMMGQAATGELTPAEAVADAERQIIPIFDRWREQGLI